jgi:hypothetical protein
MSVHALDVTRSARIHTSSTTLVVSTATLVSTALMIIIAVLLTMAWHAWAPILLEILLVLAKVLLSLLALLRVIGVLQRSLVVMDLGHVITELVTMAAVATAVLKESVRTSSVIR